MATETRMAVITIKKTAIAAEEDLGSSSRRPRAARLLRPFFSLVRRCAGGSCFLRHFFSDVSSFSADGATFLWKAALLCSRLPMEYFCWQSLLLARLRRRWQGRCCNVTSLCNGLSS